jgi:chemotaxis signal transduction protein
VNQAPTLGIEARLLAFEVGGAVYALPIGCVVEVCEAEVQACVPMLPRDTAGVMNHHGDAVPVLRRHALLGAEDADELAPTQVLVISPRPDGGPRLGLPVDRIVGLFEGVGAAARGASPVAERRNIDGRVVSILDPGRLVSRAREAIEHSLERAG